LGPHRPGAPPPPPLPAAGTATQPAHALRRPPPRQGQAGGTPVEGIGPPVWRAAAPNVRIPRAIAARSPRPRQPPVRAPASVFNM